ncbi:MAG: threonine-phosphate decarboxylase [Nitrospirae bacterium]|nr:threonine-phosphate decarboxylase [Nitrospirota bacterium]
MKFEHGGDIYRLAEELKIQERKVMDFSASINPLGVSKKVKAEIRRHLKYLHNYPDPEAKRLRKYLAQYHGIDSEMILCGNGSTELIYLIPQALKPKKVLILAPTFSEYERAVLISQESGPPTQPSPSRGEGEGGGEGPISMPCAPDPIKYFMLNENNSFEIKPEEFIDAMRENKDSELRTPNSALSYDMAFLCNPNNPTGRLLKKDAVIKIADAAKELKCYLIVDEAFIDFCLGDSVINEVQNNPYLIVLRSMTKFYALSGLRIGYGVFPQPLIDVLKKYKEPWTVNNLAQRAAVVALKDKVYRDETFRLMREEKRFLEKKFKKLGIEFSFSQANFYLLRIDGAEEICKRLKIKGILVRHCSNFRGLDSRYIRVAVKSHRENTILIRELAEIKEVMKQ